MEHYNLSYLRDIIIEHMAFDYESSRIGIPAVLKDWKLLGYILDWEMYTDKGIEVILHGYSEYLAFMVHEKDEHDWMKEGF